jgi:hypothetical protein
MTHAQFNEWYAKDIIEPIGHAGTHDILARIGVLIAMYMGNKDATEDMFKWWHKEHDRTADESAVIAVLESIGGVRT